MAKGKSTNNDLQHINIKNLFGTGTSLNSGRVKLVSYFDIKYMVLIFPTI